MGRFAAAPGLRTLPAITAKGPSDVYRDSDVDQEDVDLEEFSDEIESWIIDELKAIGCDTAKSVLELSVEELVKRTDLEEETINDVKNILKAEFE